jgi:hypothetical protein
VVMFNKIILSLLAFLLWLFPMFGPSEFDREKKFYDQQTIADTVMAPIMTPDAEALEAMICKNIKDNTPDLSEQIARLLQLTEGVTSYSAEGSDSYEGRRGSNRIFKQHVDIRFQISAVKYGLFIAWEINNFSPAEKGIRHVNLTNMDTRELLIDFVSTEGFMQWHD